MSYTHLTETELIFIEEYHSFGYSGRLIAKKFKHGHEALYRVIRQLKNGFTALDIYLQYKKNKQNCERKNIELSASEVDYIHKKNGKFGRQTSLEVEEKCLFPAVRARYIAYLSQVCSIKKFSL